MTGGSDGDGVGEKRDDGERRTKEGTLATLFSLFLDGNGQYTFLFFRRISRSQCMIHISKDPLDRFGKM